VRLWCSVEIALVQAVAIFKIYLSGEVGELILSRTFLNTTKYFALSNMFLLKRPGGTGSCDDYL
jgi:hypothetical protein